MKMDQAHFNMLAEGLKGKTATNERERWDAFWEFLDAHPAGADEVLADFYAYLNDSHIDTALRRIFN